MFFFFLIIIVWEYYYYGLLVLYQKKLFSNIFFFILILSRGEFVRRSYLLLRGRPTRFISKTTTNLFHFIIYRRVSRMEIPSTNKTKKYESIKSTALRSQRSGAAKIQAIRRPGEHWTTTSTVFRLARRHYWKIESKPNRTFGNIPVIRVTNGPDGVNIRGRFRTLKNTSQI